MARLSAFEVGRYRGISGLRLDNIAPVNLVTGENGVGKTALLEALWLFHGRGNPRNLWSPVVQRSPVGVTDPISGLADEEIRLSGTEDGEQHHWRVTFRSTLDPATGPSPYGNGAAGGNGANAAPGPIAGVLHVELDGTELAWDPGSLVNTPRGLVRVPTPRTTHGHGMLMGSMNGLLVAEGAIQDFGDLIVSGAKQELIEELRIVLPWILEVDTVVAQGNAPYVLATTRDGARLPLPALGGGVVWLFHMLVAMRRAQGSTVFLDEVETALHFKTLPALWSCLRKLAASLDVQVFASTHSHECVDAAVATFEDRWDDLALHRLRRNPENGQWRVASLRGEALVGAHEIPLELR